MIGLDTYMNCILINRLLLKVWLMGCATCLICIDWWGQGWPMVPWHLRALAVLYRMLPLFTQYEIFDVWVTISTNVHLPRMFPPRDFLFKATDRMFLNWSALCSNEHVMPANPGAMCRFRYELEQKSTRTFLVLSWRTWISFCFLLLIIFLISNSH